MEITVAFDDENLVKSLIPTLEGGKHIEVQTCIVNNKPAIRLTGSHLPALRGEMNTIFRSLKMVDELKQI